jgi:hypothetical protein
MHRMNNIKFTNAQQARDISHKIVHLLVNYYKLAIIKAQKE